MSEATETQRRAFDEQQRVTSSPEMAERYLRAMFALDVKDIAPRVACPTLVFHSRGDQLIFFEQGRKLAEGTSAEIHADSRVLEAYLGTTSEIAAAEMRATA